MLFNVATAFGQNQSQVVYDTTINTEHINNSKYYSKTDLLIIDTLELWNYKLDTSYHGKYYEGFLQLYSFIKVAIL